MTFTRRFTSPAKPRRKPAGNRFALHPARVSDFSRVRASVDASGKACPFCGQLVDVRSGIPASDPYFALHADAGGTCEGSCLSTSFEPNSNTNQTRPGTASVDRPMARDSSTEVLAMDQTKGVYRYDKSPDFERWAQVNSPASRDVRIAGVTPLPDRVCRVQSCRGRNAR